MFQINNLKKFCLVAALIHCSLFAQEEDPINSESTNLQPLMEEVVVRQVYIPDEKRATSEISNVINSEDFQFTGDSSVAGMLQRVTGLSLVQGKFIYVRGLGDRYSSATLDGSLMPSPEPLRRVVPLDILPNSLLSSVVVQKTYSPEFAGEFGGGVIQLRTLTTPSEAFFDYEFSTGMNSVTTNQAGLTYSGSDTDVFGFDDGTRDLPNAISNNVYLTGLQYSDLNAIRDELPNTWSIKTEDIGMPYGFKLAAGNIYNFQNFDLGVLLAGNYSNSYETKLGTRKTFVQTNNGLSLRDYISPETCEDHPGEKDTLCGLSSTEQEIALNGIFAAGLDFDNHQLKYTSMLLRKSENRALFEQGEFRSDPGELRRFNRIEWIERQVWSNQVSGFHSISLLSADEPTEIEWRAGYAMATRDAPLTRTTRYDYVPTLEAFRISARTDGNRTSWGYLEDNTIETGLDIRQVYYINNLPWEFKTGFAYLDKDRDSEYLRYGFDFPPGNNNALRLLPAEQIFTTDGFYLEEFVDASDFFQAGFTNNQFYLGTDAQLTDRIRMAAGFRVEDSLQSVATVNRLTRESVNKTIEEQNVLPALTFTYEFDNNMQVRLGFSQTLSRPDLRELSAANFVDPVLNRNVRGNPDLVTTYIDSIDFRWEYYFAPGQSMTFGIFQKDFENPIERSYQILGEEPIRLYQNAFSATLTGWEAEAEWIIGQMGNKEFFLKGNYSSIESEIILDPEAIGQATSQIRPMQGQSDSLANFQIGFEDLFNESFLTFNVNYTGDRIYEVGLFGVPDVIETPPVLANIVYSHPFVWGGHDYEVGFSISNLLDENFLLTQGGEVAEEYQIGRALSLNFKGSF